jgi:hypothetical protein
MSLVSPANNLRTIEDARRLPVPVLDLYLRCWRSLHALKLSIIYHPEDARGRS